VNRKGHIVQIGEPQRIIIVEPLELPVGNPVRIEPDPEPEPTILPEREPVEPEKVPVAP
jgi:hypothetical protein